MGTIIGRQHTPQDNNGNRDVIHPETQIDAVLDPVTGVPLRQQLKNITDLLVPVDVNSGKPGLVTPELIVSISQAAENTIVVDSIKPTFSKGGYWFNIYDPKMTTVDPE